MSELSTGRENSTAPPALMLFVRANSWSYHRETPLPHWACVCWLSRQVKLKLTKCQLHVFGRFICFLHHLCNEFLCLLWLCAERSSLPHPPLPPSSSQLSLGLATGLILRPNKAVRRIVLITIKLMEVPGGEGIKTFFIYFYHIILFTMH